MNLDHVGFIVEDLAVARDVFARLGFTLTARADHTRRDAQGRIVPAGSSQHSVMFETGYIELMQITDPAAGHQLTAAMQERFGLHVLALGTDDAQACHAQRQSAGLPVGAVMDWSRPVSTPERSGLARFLYFDTPWSPGDPSYLCWVQHATPELIRSPSLLRHGNGARCLRALHYSGPSQRLREWSRRLVLAGGQPAGGRLDRLRFGPSGIDLHADEGLGAARPKALTLGLRDPQALADAAKSQGLAVRTGPDGQVDVDLSSLCGLHLRAVAEAGS